MEKKILFIIAGIGMLIASYALFLDQYVTIGDVREYLSRIAKFYQANPTTTIIAYIAMFIISTVLSIPATAILSIAAGALFGLGLGIPLVLFSATTGAVLSFLLARYFFGHIVQKKYKCHLDSVNEGIDRDGNYYLFSLRVMPILPFCVINILMGLTKMRLWDYIIMTLIGITSWVVIYVYAGTMIRKIKDFEDIISYDIAIALVLLGVFPILIKRILGFVQRRKSTKEKNIKAGIT